MIPGRSSLEEEVATRSNIHCLGESLGVGNDRAHRTTEVRATTDISQIYVHRQAMKAQRTLKESATIVAFSDNISMKAVTI